MTDDFPIETILAHVIGDGSWRGGNASPLDALAFVDYLFGLLREAFAQAGVLSLCSFFLSFSSFSLSLSLSLLCSPLLYVVFLSLYFSFLGFILFGLLCIAALMTVMNTVSIFLPKLYVYPSPPLDAPASRGHEQLQLQTAQLCGKITRAVADAWGAASAATVAARMTGVGDSPAGIRAVRDSSSVWAAAASGSPLSGMARVPPPSAVQAELNDLLERTVGWFRQEGMWRFLPQLRYDALSFPSACRLAATLYVVISCHQLLAAHVPFASTWVFVSIDMIRCIRQWNMTASFLFWCSNSLLEELRLHFSYTKMLSGGGGWGGVFAALKLTSFALFQQLDIRVILRQPVRFWTHPRGCRCLTGFTGSVLLN